MPLMERASTETTRPTFYEVEKKPAKKPKRGKAVILVAIIGIALIMLAGIGNSLWQSYQGSLADKVIQKDRDDYRKAHGEDKLDLAKQLIKDVGEQ